MQAKTLNQHQHRTTEFEDSSRKRPNPQFDRLPRRTVCRVHELTLSNSLPPLMPDSKLSTYDVRQNRHNRPCVGVSAIPSSNPSCRHHVFVEHDALLKKLDLPSAARVTVSERFKATAGDTLSLQYVAILSPGSGIDAGDTTVRAVIVDLLTQYQFTLFDQTSDSDDDDRFDRMTSRVRESRSFAFPADGQYEIRYVTSVDPENLGSKAQLLVNSVRVLNQAGNEVKRLASISCAGCVRGLPQAR